MIRTLRVATYNIHKGFSHGWRRVILPELREQLRMLGADIVFLQEVMGAHHGHAQRYTKWPRQSQYEFLADATWCDFAYGRNALYTGGHHGNAVLSRFPIERWDNEDISAHRYEHRGLLHCELRVAGWETRLHCICVHLGLFTRSRKKQYTALGDRIRDLVPDHAPLIVAGDFNDWRAHADREFARQLGLQEAFEVAHGKLARSYPSFLPLLRLDRIYARGFRIEHAEVCTQQRRTGVSDHVALSATLRRT
ncbi:MAG: endonuclease/exonuclease/phosphatase family protein [Burkholderiales bacterium]